MSLLPTFPLFDDQVAFTVNPNTSEPQSVLNAAWVSMGYRTRSASTTQGRQYELGQVQAGTGTYDLINQDEALNAANTSSVYYPNVLPLRRFRTVAAWNAGIANPSTATPGWSGNVLNDTNSGWVDAPVGASDGSFEDLTVGHWTAGGTNPPILSNDTAHNKFGSRALKCAFTGAPGANAGAYLTVPTIPGVQTTVSAWVFLGAAAGMTGAQIATLGYTAGTATSTLGAFVQISQTFTPTTATVLVRVVMLGTGSGNGWIDGVQVEYGTGTPSGSNVTTGPTLYAQFTGYAERWPEAWSKRGYWGESSVPVVDAFAILPRLTLRDVVAQEIIADNPAAYYPCTEASGSLFVKDLTGNNDVGSVYLVPNGVGQQTSPLVTIGDSASVCAEGLPSILMAATGVTGGPFLQFGLGAALPSANWTLECATFTTSAILGFFSQTVIDQTVFVSNEAGAFYSLGVQVEVTSDANFVYFTGSVGQGSYLGGPVLPSTGWESGPYTVGVHHVAVTLAADGKTMTMYVDGVNLGSAAAASAVTIPNVAPSIGAKWNGQNLAPMNVGQVAAWDTVISATRIAAHAQAVLTAFSGEMSGTRYSRIAAYLSAFLPTSVDAGMTPMGPAVGLGGQDVLSALNDVVTTEGGQHWVSRSGVLTFAGRARRYLVHTSAWTLGEQTAAAGGSEIAYQDDIATDFDLQFVFNDVDVQRTGGALQNYQDPVSQDTYFDSQTSITFNGLWDTEARDVATWTVQQHKDPHTRFSTITVEASAQPAAWPFVLGVAQGDRVTVKRRTAAGYTINLDCYVEQIAPARGEATGSITLLLSPVWTTNVWILGDATYSVLGTSTILAR